MRTRCFSFIPGEQKIYEWMEGWQASARARTCHNSDFEKEMLEQKEMILDGLFIPQ